jgi:hypothetical protein
MCEVGVCASLVGQAHIVNEGGPITGGSRPFTTLSLWRTISCPVYEWPLLRLSDGISCRVPDIDSLIWPFHHLLRARAIVPLIALSALVA